MRLRAPHLLLLASILFLTSCTCIREGVVKEKRSRVGLIDPYSTWLTFRYEPDIYWVTVEGRDDKGRVHHKNILLFRHDWEQLRVGDHWSCQSGFSPAESYEK